MEDDSEIDEDYADILYLKACLGQIDDEIEYVPNENEIQEAKELLINSYEDNIDCLSRTNNNNNEQKETPVNLVNITDTNQEQNVETENNGSEDESETKETKKGRNRVSSSLLYNLEQ
jgi:hypothetical protein